MNIGTKEKTMKKILLLTICTTQLLFGISPEEFPYKQQIKLKNSTVAAFFLDPHVIETLNAGKNNLIIINKERKIVPYKIIKQNSTSEYELNPIPTPKGTDSSKSTKLYLKSPKLYFKEIILTKSGTLPHNTRLNINGYMQNIKDKRTVARSMTRVPSTSQTLMIPLFKETYYPFYELEIKPAKDISIERIVGTYKNHLLLFKSSKGPLYLYYGSNHQYPVSKIHNQSLNLSQKPSIISTEPWSENASYNDPNKLKKAWTYPKFILLIAVIVGLIVTLQWVKKRKQ